MSGPSTPATKATGRGLFRDEAQGSKRSAFVVEEIYKHIGFLVACLLSHDHLIPLPISLVLNSVPLSKAHQFLAIVSDRLKIISVRHKHSPMEVNVNITTHTCYQFWFPISVEIPNFQGQ